MSHKKEDKKLKPWFLNGSHPNEYDYGIDDEITYDGKRSAFVRSKVDETNGFGGLMQSFKADRYRGKRMKYSAGVKCKEVENWSGLWMRVDKNRGETLRFDNMEDRAIEGTKEWERYQVVLDVPEEAKGICFGILVAGKGQVWISDVKFEETTDESTGRTERLDLPDEPDNLDFANYNASE